MVPVRKAYSLMSIQSMTGYGMGEAESYRVEVRSTNHKGMYVQVNLPQYLFPYESEVRNLIKERFHRGYFEIYLSRLKGENLNLKINIPLAKEYYQALVSLKDELSIPDNVDINVLAMQKDIFHIEEVGVKVSVFRKAFDAALEELEKMRVNEGKHLVEDIIKRTNTLNNKIASVEGKREQFVMNSKKVLTERLKNLLCDVKIDDSRLIQEVAILVERSDITEEVVRIKSHLNHMEDILQKGDEIGKKIGFMVQEVHRELNTIGSKAFDSEISVLVVDMKYELEKIREQVQNLE